MSKREFGAYTLAEVWKICKTSYNCKGCPFLKKGEMLCPLGSRPDAWTLSLVTEPERELLRLTGTKFISRDESGDFTEFVCLWESRPEPSRCPPGFFINRRPGPTAISSRLPAALFPSVLPGMCLDVTTLIGEETEEPTE